VRSSHFAQIPVGVKDLYDIIRVIFIYPLISIHCPGTSGSFTFPADPNDDNQVKLIINPPPVSAEDFRNARLLIEVF
jgi:hypothetical protein